MDYQGRSLKDGSVDPALLATVVELERQVGILQGEVTTLESEVKTLEQTVITLGLTDQLCFLEAQVTLDPRPGQESFDILQPVSLTGLNPPLYFSSGYAPDVRVALLAFNSMPDLYVLASGDNIYGIRWASFRTDEPDARFHVTGCATFMLPFSTIIIALRARYTLYGGQVVTVDYNRLRLPARSAQDQRIEYKIDEYVDAQFTTIDCQFLDFYVVVNTDFGTATSFTDTVTGGWDTQYRNFLRVQRVK